MNVNPKKIVKEKIIEACEYTSIQQVGTDVSVSDIIILKNGEFKNVACNEVVRVPKDMFALVVSRSTFNRNGVLVRGCVFDPGYNGKIHLSVYNLSGKRYSIPKNERIAQIVFFRADAASSYNGQYQNEKIGDFNVNRRKN